MRIEPISSVEINEIYKMAGTRSLTPEEFDDLKKFYMVQKNNAHVLHMDRNEYQTLLKKRPLLRFRPLKNSFVHKGDKKLLAIGLSIDEPQINKYIKNIIANNFDIQNANKTLPFEAEPLNTDKFKMVQDYVYRHGKKDQALAFLENELSDTKSVLRRLYKTLEKNSGGIYDYFERPCHLLDNQTAHKMHSIIKYGLDNALKQGFITEDVNKTACEWALRQIYDIQSNQKVREALKITKYSG